MFGNIFTRNIGYAVKHPVRTWAVRSACQKHVKKNPMCAWCGGITSVEAHHIIPLWSDDTLGAAPSNFISLCRDARCHLLIGHNGNFTTRFIPNVKEICELRQITTRDRGYGDGVVNKCV